MKNTLIICYITPGFNLEMFLYTTMFFVFFVDMHQNPDTVS